MSRMDGKYPTYNKLEIDKDNWPVDYWEGSRLCEVCATQWPRYDIFDTSPCCGSNTVLDREIGPEMRWPTAVERLLQFRFDEWYEEWNAGLTDEQLAWHPETIEQEINEFKQALEAV